MKMFKLSWFSLILFFTLFMACAQKSNVQSPDGYQLVWSDEFDTDGLPDASKWSYDYGDGCPGLCGWGNKELQFYNKEKLENSRVENGFLIIEARKEQVGRSAFTSARLATKNKGDWKYGRFDIRAKLPSGKGTWPAIWMLPTDMKKYGGWPRCGEIDIMEHVGIVQDSVYGTVHTGAYNHKKFNQKGGVGEVSTAESDFHTYSIIWDAKKIEWLVDDQKYFEFENEEKTIDEWPFDQPFHLLLNVAVGGFWGGRKGVDLDIWPQRMEVDYVRVYQKQ